METYYHDDIMIVSPEYFTFAEHFYINDFNEETCIHHIPGKQICANDFRCKQIPAAVKRTIEKINEIKTIDTFLKNI